VDSCFDDIFGFCWFVKFSDEDSNSGWTVNSCGAVGIKFEVEIDGEDEISDVYDGEDENWFIGDEVGLSYKVERFSLLSILLGLIFIVLSLLLLLLFLLFLFLLFPIWDYNYKCIYLKPCIYNK